MVNPHPKIALIYHYDLARALAGEPVDWQAIPVDLDVGRRGGEIAAAAKGHERTEKPFGAPVIANKVAVGGSPSFTVGTTATQREPLAASNRDRLRERIRTLQNQGHKPALHAAWPQGVPPLTQTGHTTEQLEAILAAVRKVEADIGAQFHDDDMEANKPQPRQEANPQPVVEPIDEGVNLTEEEVAELAARFQNINPERLRLVAEITGDAKAAGRPIAVSLRPCERRGLLASALIDWALSDTPYDDLWTAATLIATEHQTVDPDQRLGALISQFTIDQARNLANTYAELSAA